MRLSLSRIYAKRKVDVEPVFGRMKGVLVSEFVRGTNLHQDDSPLSLNLTKLAKKIANRDDIKSSVCFFIKSAGIYLWILLRLQLKRD